MHTGVQRGALVGAPELRSRSGSARAAPWPAPAPAGSAHSSPAAPRL